MFMLLHSHNEPTFSLNLTEKRMVKRTLGTLSQNIKTLIGGPFNISGECSHRRKNSMTNLSSLSNLELPRGNTVAAPFFIICIVVIFYLLTPQS